MIQRLISVVALGFVLPLAAIAQFASPAPFAAATAPETFDFILGAQIGNGATYTVKATAPGDSAAKSQRVRFIATVPTSTGTTTRYFTVNTGKYKTIGQTGAYLHEVFAKFLAGAPMNAEVGKIGDVKYGGEIHFVVESLDSLRYETLSPGEAPASMSLPKAEIAAYATILAGSPAR